MTGLFRRWHESPGSESRVTFGERGRRSWLRTLEYARLRSTTSPYGQARYRWSIFPIKVRMYCAWVLGNCFYVIDFAVSAQGLHNEHRRTAQGTPRRHRAHALLRAVGRGISPETRKMIDAAAREEYQRT